MRSPIVPIVAAGAALALVLVSPRPAAADGYEGQVVQVQERVQLGNGGERQQITVRTREGEELRFNLGAPGSCPNCVAVGDQVRVRTTRRAAASDGAFQARRMSVEGSGRQHTFCSRSGDLIPTQSRSYQGRGGSGQGAGDMDRTRDRDRIHAPGTGPNCPAGAGARAGARGNGGGPG